MVRSTTLKIQHDDNDSMRIMELLVGGRSVLDLSDIEAAIERLGPFARGKRQQQASRLPLISAISYWIYNEFSTDRRDKIAS